MKAPNILKIAMALAFAVIAAAPVVAAAVQEPQWQSANEIWEKVCSRCHMTGVGPQITGRKLPVEYIESVVRNGYNAMPSFRASELSDQDLDAIARYVSESKAKN